jgi:hypothetical protein
MLVRSTSTVIARSTASEARPEQVRQVKRLAPVACLGLVGAALMWLACWAKPSVVTGLGRWLEGESEIYSGTVRQDTRDYTADYFSVRLEARFYHQHADVRLASPAYVWANGARTLPWPPLSSIVASNGARALSVWPCNR